METTAENPKRKYCNTLNAPSNNNAYGIQSEHMQFSPFDISLSPENNFSYSFSMSISSEEDKQLSPALPIDQSNQFKLNQTNSSDNNISTDISAFTSKDSGSMTIANPTHSQSSTDVMSCCPIISDSQENAELREFAIEVLSDLLVHSFDHTDKEKIISNASTILGRKENASIKNKLLFKSTDNEEQRQFTMEVLSDFLSNSFDEFDNISSCDTKETLKYNSSKERINTYFTPMSSISTTSSEITKTSEPANKKVFIGQTSSLKKTNSNFYYTQQNMVHQNNICNNQQSMVNQKIIQTPITTPMQPPPYYLVKPIPPQDIFVNLKEYIAANNYNVDN